MKNSGTRKAMQTPTWRSICAMLCLLLLLSALFPVKAAAETVPAKVVRVGSFEDTFNYVNEKGIRKGYGYELLQTLSGYTGWQLEYVTCDWSDCFEKLKNGEIDIMGDISYTEDRTEEMLFSDEPMGEEKDCLLHRRGRCLHLHAVHGRLHSRHPDGSVLHDRCVHRRKKGWHESHRH